MKTRLLALVTVAVMTMGIAQASFADNVVVLTGKDVQPRTHNPLPTAPKPSGN